MTEFDTFLEAAWADHADRADAVADRLGASLHFVQTAEQVARYAALVTHVFGEHLGNGARGIALLESLGALRAAADSSDATRALARNIAALRHAAGDPVESAALPHEDRVSALAMAASICAARSEFAKGLDAYAEALRQADAGLLEGTSALRALAVAGNNLAAALEEKKDRDPRETARMVDAAREVLKHWKLAGTWLEEERAQYRLARSLLQAGAAEAAADSARRCVEVCERHDAPAFERFFGHAVLALAQRGAGDPVAFEASRAQARDWFEQVSNEERPWCDAELKELAG
ncbi:MAG TPA: hypothetical protein VF308_00925 [Caldimonas sp.]